MDIVEANSQTQNQYTQNKIDHISKGSQTFNSTEINNANGDWHVKYVDEDGKAVADGKDINISSAVNDGKYSDVPNGYVLNNPDGTYSVVNQGALTKDTLKGNITVVPSTTRQIKHDAITHTETQWAEHDDDGTYKVLYGMSDYAKKHAAQEYKDNVMSNDGVPKWERRETIIVDKPAWTETVSNNDGYDKEDLPIAFVNERGQIIGNITTKTGKVGTTDNINLQLPYGYKLASGQTMPKTVTYSDNKAPVLINVIHDDSINNTITNPSGNTIHVNFVDQNTGKKVGDQTINLNSAEEGTNFYQTPNGWATDNNGRYDVGTPFSRGYLTITDDKGNNTQQLILNAKQAQDFFEAFRKGHDTDLRIQAHLPASHPDEINLADLAYNGVSTYDKENGDRSWENIVYNATKKVIQTAVNRHMTDNYGQDVFDGYYGKITAKRYNAYTFTDNYHSYDASTNTITVPVHQSSSLKFIDNSNNVVSADTASHTLTVSVLKPYDTQATAVDFIDTDVDAQSW